MKKLSTAAALLLVGALALAGCTTLATEAPDAAPASPVAAQQVADAKPAPSVEPTGATPALTRLATTTYEAWAEANPREATRVIVNPTNNHWADILAWDAPRAGEIVIDLDGLGWTKTMLESQTGTLANHLHGSVETATFRAEDANEKTIKVIWKR